MINIKKLLFFLLLMVLATNFSFAQDMITKKTGEDIKAKVLEVSTTKIKYYKFDMPDGPIYTILKSDVLIIRYQNGTKDIFDDSKQLSKKNDINKKIENKKIYPIKEEVNKKTIKNDTLKNNESKIKIVNNYKIKYGIKGGLNYANLTSGDSKAIIAYNIGGFLEYKFNKLFSFQPELQFSEQGFKNIVELRENFYDPITAQTIIYIFDYINMPILAKFNINEEINFVIGPQIGYLSNVKIGGVNFSKNNVNTIDYGVDFGAGITFNKILVDIRYDLGLSEVFKYAGFNTSNKNSLFQLSLGYKF